MQLPGSASKVVISVMGDFQPGRVTYVTSTFARTPKSAERNLVNTFEEDERAKSQTWESRKLFPANHVLGRDLDLGEVVKDIKLGEIEAVIAVDETRVFHHDQVQPSTTPPPAGSHTPLPSNLLQMDTGVLHEYN